MKTYFKIICLIFLFSLLIPPLTKAITFESPFKAKSFEELIDAIINFIFWVAIAIVPIMIVVAAFYFLTSAGDPEKTRTAKRIIFYTIIGLIIIFLAKGIPGIIRQLLFGPPPPVEICNNSIDDDGDGLTDCLDPDCVIDPVACPCPPEICHDLLVLVVNSYGAKCGDPKYNPIADANKDKVVNVYDAVTVTSQCGDAVACQAMWNDTSNPCP